MTDTLKKTLKSIATSGVELPTLSRQAACQDWDVGSKLLMDTLNYFLSKIIPGLMGLFAVLVFVRLVGYEQYGRYAVVFATVTAFSAGVAGWLSQSILRFQSKHHEGATAESFNKAIDRGLLLSIVLGGGVLGVSLWFGKHSFTVLVVSVGLYVAMLAYTVKLTRLQASLDSHAVVRMEAVRAVGALVVPLVLIAMSPHRQYWLLLLGIFVGYLIPVVGRTPSITARAAFITLNRPLLGAQERAFLRSLWSYGWPVALWLFSQQGMVVADRHFIQKSWGYSAAGVYASMYDVIVRSFSLIFAPITLSVHTVLMHHWNTGTRHQTQRILSQAIKYESLLFLPAAAALFFSGSSLSRLVLGHGNAEAASIVLPLAIGGFLWQIALLAHKPLEILCQTKRMLIGAAAALAVNVFGNYLLTPHFGYQAAAYLSVASSVVYLAMLFVLTPTDSFQRAIATGDQHGTAIITAQEVSV